ncbi:MAG: rhodanese-like domain-containing protein [Pirellula sp.]
MGTKRVLTLVLLCLIHCSTNAADESRQNPPTTEFVHSKTPTSYCGLYCVFVAAKSIGVELRMEDLVREDYLTGRDGSSIGDLVNASRANGMYAKARSGLAVEDLMIANCPMILHVRSPGSKGYYHWSLFLGFDENGQAKIFDPPVGKGRLSKATLLSIWDGIAIDVSREKNGVVSLPFNLSNIALGATAFCGLLLIRRWCPKGWQVPIVGLCLSCVTLALPSGFIWNRNAVRLVSSAHFRIKLPEISHEELMNLLESEQVVLIDTRPADMFQSGSIPRAINIPISSSEISLQNALAELQKNRSKRVITYCQGIRCGWADSMGNLISKRAAIPVFVYAEGLNGWHSREGK